jgi:hypothetical protein
MTYIAAHDSSDGAAKVICHSKDALDWLEQSISPTRANPACICAIWLGVLICAKQLIATLAFVIWTDMNSCSLMPQYVEPQLITTHNSAFGFNWF